MPRSLSNRARASASILLALALPLSLSACGGDDDEVVDVAPAETTIEGSTDTADDAVDGGADEAGDGGAGADGETVRDVLTDELGEQGEQLDDVISSLGAETRFEAVASQLDPEPSVEVDGGDIRLVFDGGSIDQATFDCIVAGAFVEDGETVTVVYPDGEQTC